MGIDMPPEGSQTPPPYSPPPISSVRPPPLIAPLVAPQPAPKRTGWKIFAPLLFLALGFRLLFNFAHFVSGVAGAGGVRAAHSFGPRLEEVTIRDNDSANKIVVIPIEGIITGQVADGGYSMVTVIKEELKRARDDRSV